MRQTRARGGRHNAKWRRMAPDRRKADFDWQQSEESDLNDVEDFSDASARNETTVDAGEAQSKPVESDDDKHVEAHAVQKYLQDLGAAQVFRDGESHSDDEEVEDGSDPEQNPAETEESRQCVNIRYQLANFVSSNELEPATSGNRAVFIKGHRRGITRIKLSSDGRNLISSSKDGAIGVWDVETQSKLFTRRQETDGLGPHHQIADFDLSNDDQLIVLGTDTGFFGIFDWNRTPGMSSNDLGSISKSTIMNRRCKSISGVRFSNSASELLAYVTTLKGEIHLWNLQMSHPINTYYGHVGAITCLDITPVGNKLITGGGDGTVRLWQGSDDCHTMFSSSKLRNPIDSVAWLNDGTFVSGNCQSQLVVWRSQSRKPVASGRVAQFSTDKSKNCAITALSRISNESDTQFVSGDQCGTVKLWEYSQVSGRGRTAKYQLRLTSQFDLVSASAGVLPVVTCVAVCARREFAAVAASNESRISRWYTCPGAKNGIYFVRLARAVN